MAKSGWDVLILSRWLDARLFQKDVRQEVLLEYLRRTVVYLVEKRRIPFEALVRARFALQKVLEFKIKNLRKKAYDRGYQETLFGENSVARTSFEYAFKFNPENYPAKFPYQGMYVFNNHYYKYPGELKSEGEEFECAKVIDQHPKVKCWVRNLERQQEYSFSLPTSTDLFYPDFVCLLNDRRIFVVEYKGEQYRTNDDSKEKNNIGQLWEEKSGGKALFLMLTDVKGKSLFGQIDAKIQINSENKQRNK
jgi:type III restriction enzyme